LLKVGSNQRQNSAQEAEFRLKLALRYKYKANHGEEYIGAPVGAGSGAL
jgi:hypothetical protein